MELAQLFQFNSTFCKLLFMQLLELRSEHFQVIILKVQVTLGSIKSCPFFHLSEKKLEFLGKKSVF